jgi:peptidoglycan/LPS O-acetylase OafA/YrhL
VFFAHAGDFAKHLGVGQVGGSFGVMLFFVLSGFLMGTLYLDRPWSRETVIQYGVARFVRIAPIYIVVVLISYGLYAAWPSFAYPIDNSNLMRHLLFSGNAAMFWSIPPEVQFYGVFILLWFAVAAYRVQGWVAPLVVLTIAMLLCLAYGYKFPGTFVGAHIQFFMSGIAAAWLRPRIGPALAGTWELVVLQGAMCAMFALTVNFATSPFDLGLPLRYHPDARALIPGALVLAISIPSPFSSVIFANRGMRAIGAWSFSLYLVHLALLKALSPVIGTIGETAYIVVSFVVCLAVSATAYRLVERPSQRVLRPLLLNALTRASDRIGALRTRDAPSLARDLE